MNEPKTLESRIPAPDTKSWYAYIWQEQQQSPNRLEDAAKFLASMISISLTIFLAIGKKAFENIGQHDSVKVAVVLWLLSLLFSFFVLFPWRYRFVSESIKSIKAMHKKVVRVKRVLLILSLVLFLTALTLLAVLFLFPA